ncbi:hybrid sensor histidine kinase/response regulator [Ramlibacter tataouinensis]|uniref:histidine kinase n=1 Tax=Ramlibacter tataouinensis (strain ATCC BAA-407 / DSM 14655 / LMG 21543 / TTB310) TaxID=365046 RepID=F5Y086_RAMTT|nr:ATP-binding protein [Ramlibacter tataouinensis]AEG92108.1 candidate histidine kinase, hybrid [Ramlibacter tataouinensis TTB310]
MSPGTPSPPRLERHWPAASLRTYLVAVILLATFPLSALMSWQILMDARAQQDQVEDGLARSAASFAQAVDSELLASLDALTALSHSEVLQEGGPGRLQQLWRWRPRPRRDWDSVFLLDPAGGVLFDTASGGAEGPAPELDGVRRLVTQRLQPAVSGLLPRDGTDGPAVILAVPLVREGEPGHVLGARIGPAVWQRLASGASRPQGGYAALLDAQYRTISHTAGPEVAAAGDALPPATAQTLRGQPFGVHRALNSEGRAVYAAWQAVPVAGWTVRVGTPAQPIDAGHRRAILGALATSGASLLLGVLLAALAARRVTRPLHQLATGGPARLAGPAPVKEVALLRHALLRSAQRDAAARARLEATAEELRESHQLMALAQEAGQVGFFHYRFGADQLDWTPGQHRLFGTRPDTPMAGLAGWFARIDGDDRDRVEREFWTACALRREGWTLEYCITAPDGRSRWLSSRVTLHYDADGRAVQMVGVTVDMTAHREAQLQREQLTERAIAARRQAEAASRAKDEFLAMLSHELRNPLGAVSAAVEVLEIAPADSPSATEARGIIARQTRNLAHMMDDLLDVGRALAGKVRLLRQPVDLAAVAIRVRQTLSLTGEAGGHELRLHLDEAWVEGDAVRLEQVVTQLVTNAFKYTPAGSPVDVSTGLQDGMAQLEVRDCGAGIPPELLPRVFDLFVQGERPLDRRAGGLGLGLTLVRSLVELHGGTVSAANLARGSSFTVRLPAVAPPVRQAGDTLPPSRRRHVLVVEDNQDVLAALRSKLELDGHDVSTASDGIDGLHCVLQLRPEVSIVDIGLPGLTGYELARHARAAGYAGRMIALSGYGRDRDADDAYTAGFDAYLVKPVDRRQLRASLEER